MNFFQNYSVFEHRIDGIFDTKYDKIGEMETEIIFLDEPKNARYNLECMTNMESDSAILHSDSYYDDFLPIETADQLHKSISLQMTALHHYINEAIDDMILNCRDDQKKRIFRMIKFNTMLIKNEDGEDEITFRVIVKPWYWKNNGDVCTIPKRSLFVRLNQTSTLAFMEFVEEVTDDIYYYGIVGMKCHRSRFDEASNDDDSESETETELSESESVHPNE